VDAKTIIHGLGDFKHLDSRCPARYAARLSQAFTATDAVSVEVEEILHIEDISTADNKFHFTDGVGTLSPALAREIWTHLKSSKRRARSLKTHPSSFQIRLMGSKGMLSVDYRLSGNTICLRPSMIKFEAPNSTEIEVARAFDRPGSYFLNRPLIMLLEGLGVQFDVFKKYQDMAVVETRKAGDSLKQAATMLENFGLGSSYRLPSVLLSLDKLDIFSFPNNPFYEKMLEYAINHVLRDLKNYARIPVPKAWTLVGVADVHKYLKPNEIFACVKPIKGKAIYLEGPILISRSPTIHPGDVMVVNAIGFPPPRSDCPFAKEPLSNTVVFSILGKHYLDVVGSGHS
jgi:RNA-dependent RNA polymerase